MHRFVASAERLINAVFNLFIQPLLATPGKRFWSTVSLVVLFWICAFFPFKWDPPQYIKNAATQLADGTIDFSAPGMARTEEAPSWLPMAIAANELQIHLDVLPYQSKQKGPARILTISKTFWRQNLVIGQAEDSLVVRLRRPGSTEYGTPSFIVEGVFAEGQNRAIQVRIGPQRLDVKIDGQNALSAPLPTNALATWDSTFALALGNELVGGRPWRGQIKRAEIKTAGFTIDYTEAGNIATPSGWWEFSTRIPLQRQNRLFSTDLLDFVLNILGFIPFGMYFLCLKGKRGSLVYTILMGTAMSLSMEVGQFFFEGRYPSVVDLLLNALGAGLGWHLGTKLSWKPAANLRIPNPL